MTNASAGVRIVGGLLMCVLVLALNGISPAAAQSTDATRANGRWSVPLRRVSASGRRVDRGELRPPSPARLSLACCVTPCRGFG
jgi:hypothetical protein